MARFERWPPTVLGRGDRLFDAPDPRREGDLHDEQEEDSAHQSGEEVSSSHVCVSVWGLPQVGASSGLYMLRGSGGGARRAM